jgi:hypothetical protein
MSLLDKTSSKVSRIREITSPFHIMGVTSIIVEKDFFMMEDILNKDELNKLTLMESDHIEVIGGCDVDLMRRFAFYICRYHLEHPDRNKLYYDDVIRDGKPNLPINMWLSLDVNWSRILYVVIPNGARMIIKTR